ncbi:DNA replication licensing factor MCM2, putative [Theileria equi strain WA]|uniref:DNA replication licensing factor MCM2 n=1 Tax=Theileria equi strain WA TaxID=1537102 RepID=L0AW41_THEEQ|nr:DNA replication licensing factor MCM2, putative [Theileria equi strain WA]AFZ79443.1 DNA replication licensing factor MCM2, putative [Theileria equi strain WA]|eukprot:XP_004829109.1 DNA replication licensing factor MCM2, putative [Theileria equi strain WA]
MTEHPYFSTLELLVHRSSAWRRFPFHSQKHTDEVYEDEHDREDYFAGEGLRDEEEEQAELEGEDLYEDETGFVVGQRDLERELQGFAKLGIDNVNEYDQDLLDDEVYEDDPKARRAAERRMQYEARMRSRDAEVDRSVHQRLWKRIMNMEDDDVDENLFERISERVAKRRTDLAGSDADAPDISMLEGAKAILHSTPSEVHFDEKYQQAVDCCFRYFLYRFKINDSADGYYYVNKIGTMIREDKCTLRIAAQHLLQFHCENVVTWLEFRPCDILPVLHDCLTFEAHRMRPDLYAGRYCKVAITDWPFTTQLSHLRSSELNTLIRVSGIVIRRGAVLPRLRVLYLKCNTCDSHLSELPIYFSDTIAPVFPKKCPYCHAGGFTVDRINTVYTDYQKLIIQEPPSTVPAGRTPRQRNVILTGDLVDSVKPGDLVDVLGIYKTRYDVGLNIKHGFPVLHTELEANNIERQDDTLSFDITEEDIAEIKKLAADPCIRERLISSVAPTLWGHKSAKAAICYALFGGVQKGSSSFGFMGSSDDNNSHRIRGDINVLLVGDPGLGKSQLLQYVHKTGHRTVLTTGKGASAVGLTASVRRDPITNEWCLEGGALVLADEGFCVIDEFDKMTDKDRVSIHEAMEQQSISISKAGIVATLRARCSVIAAANPKFGRYEPSYTFKENVDFNDPILSRFDLIIVLCDIPNLEEDSLLSEYVITNHQLLHPRLDNVDNYHAVLQRLQRTIMASSVCEPINQDLFKKYVYYARRNIHPEVAPECYKEIEGKLIGFYSRIRQNSSLGGYPLTLRHVETVIRIAEANAKMRLSNRILSQDVDLAIAILLESYISSQKYSVATRLSREFSRYRTLFAGSDDVLSRLLRGALQQQVEKSTRQAQAREMHRADNAEDGAADDTERTHAFLPCNIFLRIASKYKFDKDRVERWMYSSHFNEQFSIKTHDGVEGIVLRRFNVF